MPDDKILAAIAGLRDGMTAFQAEVREEMATFRVAVREDMTAFRVAVREETTGFRVAVMDRFDRVEARLSQISDDITVTMGRADRAHTAADSTRIELRALGDEVAALTRKQRRMEAQLHDLTRPPGNA